MGVREGALTLYPMLPTAPRARFSDATQTSDRSSDPFGDHLTTVSLRVK